MITIIQLALAIIIVESGGNDSAIGDDGQAYGCMQMHSAYVQDVNRILQEDRYSHEDAFNRKHAIDMFTIYMLHYCTEERLGDSQLQKICPGCTMVGPTDTKKQPRSTGKRYKQTYYNKCQIIKMNPYSRLTQKKFSAEGFKL